MIGDIIVKFNQIDKILISKKLMIEGDRYHEKLRETKKILEKDNMYKNFERFGKLRDAVTHSLYEEQRAGIMLPAILPSRIDYYVKVRINKEQEDSIQLQVVYDEFLNLYTILQEYLNTYKNE